LAFSKLSEAIDRIINRAIEERVFPGATIWIGWRGRTAKLTAYGKTADIEYTTHRPKKVTTDTLYDLASLTKVVATTPAIMQLIEDGQLSLEDAISHYIPQFATSPQKASVTIRHALTHTSGLPAHAKLYKQSRCKREIIDAIQNQKLLFPPGSKHLYTDLGFVLLAEIIHIVTSLQFEEYARNQLFEPLGMKDTTFNPPEKVRSRIAPTEYAAWRSGLVHGEVHDETASAMGGIAGHAGLFSTVEDLANYCKMLFLHGKFRNRRILEIDTISRMISQQGTASGQSYGLGWAIDAPYFMGSLAREGTALL
jgi:CubicO group peptidase (beta-lactamase class C family)